MIPRNVDVPGYDPALGIRTALFFVLHRSARAAQAEERQSKEGAEEVERWLRDQT
ncbi:hypothetical protein [Sciscionella marina]|uniref:hypothetical protein n=1 Tax=Sciscionella marina TaxID=508770 RepID=UPI0003A4BA6F|nr:hypothetical protein [Sciscionella marina]